MLAAAGRVDLLVEKLDNTIVMLVVAARAEEVLPSISKSICSEAKEGERFIRENQTNPTNT
jgi:3-hydroxyisobutyrate dehydrogenase-like beta-hydroxyacid dehydrogenase